MPCPDPEGPAWQLRGMAVVPGLQGEGIGSSLLTAVHRDVGEGLWCNARERAVPFYQRHGWIIVSEPFDVGTIGPHRRMVRQP